MKSTVTPLTALVAVLGIEHLAMIPVMIHAHNQPPLAATVLSGVLGAAFLASIPGLARGRRWAFWTALTGLVLATLNATMGVLASGEADLQTGSAISIVLAVAAFVVLVRANPRRTARAATNA